jgi:hypothetical protein
MPDIGNPYIVSGLLRLDTRFGTLEIGAEDGWEDLGLIDDEDCVPAEFRDDYTCLLDRWRDSYGGGHERECHAAFYFGIDPARLN